MNRCYYRFVQVLTNPIEPILTSSLLPFKPCFGRGRVAHFVLVLVNPIELTLTVSEIPPQDRVLGETTLKVLSWCRLFRHVDPQVLKALASQCETHLYTRGETIAKPKANLCGERKSILLDSLLSKDQVPRCCQ